MEKSQTFNPKMLATLWPKDISLSELFSNNHPVDLEIGCGRPHFFFDRAYNFQQRNIIGIEWKYEFIAQAERRIVREKILNARAFHGNAWLLVPLLFRPQSLSQVFVNFPDPWWKMKHKKRLVLNHTFLDVLYELIQKDGFIVLQTDVKELFIAYQELFKEHKKFFHDQQFDGESISYLLKARSHREKKCLEQGMEIYRSLFRKI
ncbi:MAG TPA: tRNA (guanosine(46)-N7)-methyltransferase TrmB [Myxococcota bacterium]|nr:tRNA (guanosine(46)-N7)-methyltransferase TrmB [Myxococcota bacterium]